jgi:ATP/maltotriose-dependent transcriptional regulator MalT
MRRAFHDDAEAVLARELRRVPEGQRSRIAAVCAQVTAAVVEGVLEEARAEPRVASALASIYQSDEIPTTTIAPWLVEAARRG